MSVSLPFHTTVSIGLTVDEVTFVRSTMKPRLFSNLGLRPRYEKRLCFMVSVRNYYYSVYPDKHILSVRMDVLVVRLKQCNNLFIVLNCVDRSISFSRLRSYYISLQYFMDGSVKPQGGLSLLSSILPFSVI